MSDVNMLLDHFDDSTFQLPDPLQHIRNTCINHAAKNPTMGIALEYEGVIVRHMAYSKRINRTDVVVDWPWVSANLEVGWTMYVISPYVDKWLRRTGEQFIELVDRHAQIYLPRPNGTACNWFQFVVCAGQKVPACVVCGKDEGDMVRCSRCADSAYCGKVCQKYDWKIGQHKTKCAKEGMRSTLKLRAWARKKRYHELLRVLPQDSVVEFKYETKP